MRDHLHCGEEVLRELVTIHREEFYRWLPTADKLPTTANPGPGDFATMYETPAQEEGVWEIVSIHIPSKASGTYQAAKIAQSMMQERMPDLRLAVVDTLNVSMCQGWMVIEAARWPISSSWSRA